MRRDTDWLKKIRGTPSENEVFNTVVGHWLLAMRLGKVRIVRAHLDESRRRSAGCR